MSSNESIISLPPNLEEPVVLRRFLARLVERLDVVLGNRAAPSPTYVSQEDLLVLANRVAEELEVASTAIESALTRLQQLDLITIESIANALAELTDRVDDNTQDIDALKNYAAIKACLLKFTVDGLGNPDLSVAFNILSSSHVSTGIYEFTLAETEFDSVDIIDNSTASIGTNIVPTVATEFHSAEFVPTGTPGVFRVQITAVIQGVGNKLDAVFTDLQVGDDVSVTAIFNVPGSTLP